MKSNKKVNFLKKNKLFLGSIIFMISIVLFAIINLDKFKMITNELFSVCTTYFGWLYLIAMLLFVIVSVCVAFSRYGNIKLGKKEDKPEYSNKSWFAMLFCAGMGVGLVFWGVSEPISHYINPLGCEGGTIDASKFAFRTVFMHWGIHPWACYAIVGLTVAYFKFKREKSGLISSTISNVITNRIVLKIVDFLAVFATIAGIVTSLGLGVLQVNSGLNYLMNVPNNVSIQIVIIVLVTIIFIISAVSGINKGVKLLSNVNLILAIFLTVFCFLIGPKLDILNNLTSGLGGYLSNIIQDSLAIETYGDNSWLSSWRIFYWAWWVAWAPFVGIFIARISKGRTIREFILGVVLAPTLASIIWFSVWGTLGISFGQDGRLTTENLTNIAASPETGLFVVLSEYPLGVIISGLTLALIVTFFVTSADSGTYVLAMLTSEGNINPAKKQKIVWGIIQAILAILLLVCGGLKPLQTISIVAALPFLCVMIVQIIALFKDLREEKEKNE